MEVVSYQVDGNISGERNGERNGERSDERNESNITKRMLCPSSSAIYQLKI